jgi:hypothetical protein
MRKFKKTDYGRYAQTNEFEGPANVIIRLIGIFLFLGLIAYSIIYVKTL